MSLEVSQFPLSEEYKKHSSIRPADIQLLRSWLKTQPHLPEEHITELDLILGYHCCDRSVEVTKQVLDFHYTFKTHSPLFKDHNFQTTVDYLKTCLPLPLEERAHDGSKVFYARLLDSDVKNFNFYECVRALKLVLDLWQFEEGSWPGFHFVVDLEGATLSHLTRLDLATLQQTTLFLQEGMLLKISRLHFLNAPPFMDRLLLLVRPFLSRRLQDNTLVHAGLRALEGYLPVSGMPRDVGGRGMTFHDASAYLIQKLKDNRSFLESEIQKRVDESRRPGKPRSMTDIFGGVEGSFKKLEID